MAIKIKELKTRYFIKEINKVEEWGSNKFK